VVGARAQGRQRVAHDLEGRRGERGRGRARLGDRQRGGEVLGHERQREAGVEAPAEDVRGDLLVGGVAAPGRDVQDLGHERRIEAEALADQERLHRQDQGSGRAQVVERLHRLAAAQRAGAKDPRPHQPEQRLDALERGRRAARHDGERGRLGPRHAARDRGVDQLRSPGCERRRELGVDRGVGGAHVDHHRTGADSLGEAAQHHLAHCRAVGQHGDDGRAAPGERARTARHLGPALARKGGGAARRRVQDHERVPARHQVPRHRPAHPAQPDEADRALVHPVPSRAIAPCGSGWQMRGESAICGSPRVRRMGGRAVEGSGLESCCGFEPPVALDLEIGMWLQRVTGRSVIRGFQPRRG
jgi:hypothetical protein